MVHRDRDDRVGRGRRLGGNSGAFLAEHDGQFFRPIRRELAKRHRAVREIKGGEMEACRVERGTGLGPTCRASPWDEQG